MAKPSKLIVVVPGLGADVSKWDALLERLKNEPHLLEGKQARWEFWHHRKGLYGFGSVGNIGLRLKAFIDQRVNAYGPFGEIILIAHSMGGLLVREAYLRSANAYRRPGEPAENPWAHKVTKFVLFAALSRGFDPDSRFRFRIGVALASLSIYRWMTLYDLTRGSPFITNLRLAWIRHFRGLAANNKDPVVVQFLGTSDTMVRRQDCLDTEQFPKSETIDIYEARHDDLMQLKDVPDPEGRYASISRVFQPDYRPPIAESPPDSQDPRHIVFVLHGIRAENTGWVGEVCSLISNADKNALPISPQYGFFSALHFFLPWVRRSRARWFQDRYSELAAKYPNAETKFYFIGHSNGTYMLGRGLQQVEMMRFERAYIAGSVLPQNYPWEARVKSGQINEIRSDGSASDWPVGLLCSALSFMRDIGTGGFAGFKAAPHQLKEFRYYPGGHSKPLEDRKNLEAIVSYVLNGDKEGKQAPSNLGKPAPWFAFLSRALRYVGPVLILLVLAIIVYALAHLGPALSLWGWIATAIVAFLIVVTLMSF